MIAGYSLVIIFQLICVLDVLLFSKEYAWLSVIILLPGVGAFAYFLIEMRPRLGNGIAAVDIYRLPGFEKMRIKHLQKELRECDSADNRYNLAEIYFKYNRPQDAYQTIKTVLEGPLRNHVYMRIAVAKLAYENGEYAESLQVLYDLDRQNSGAERKQRSLLLAMNLARTGEPEQAWTMFMQVVGSFDGEEARFRYATFLFEQKQYQEALDLAHSGITNYRNAGKLYRRSEAVWCQLLKRLKAQAYGALHLPKQANPGR
jgi:hypothetical protein